MDFEELLRDAFTYTREGVWENRNRWLKLILAIICLGLPFSGYTLRVYRGAHPAPDVDEWGRLFIDGLKLLVVALIYVLPVLLLWGLVFVLMIVAGLSESGEASLAAIALNFLLQLMMFIFQIILSVILPIAYIRFARTNTFAEAFNFRAIIDTIGRIGWLNYIVAILLVGLVVGIPMMVLIFGCIIVGAIIAGASFILFKEAGLLVLLLLIGLMVLLFLILIPLFGIFQARCMTRIYDSAVPAEPVS